MQAMEVSGEISAFQLKTVGERVAKTSSAFPSEQVRNSEQFMIMRLNFVELTLRDNPDVEKANLTRPDTKSKCYWGNRVLNLLPC